MLEAATDYKDRSRICGPNRSKTVNLGGGRVEARACTPVRHRSGVRHRELTFGFRPAPPGQPDSGGFGQVVSVRARFQYHRRVDTGPM